MFKKINWLFGKENLFNKVCQKISSFIFTLKTMFNMLLGRGESEEDHIFGICFKVLDNVDNKIFDLDCEYSDIFSNKSSDRSEYSDIILKDYILCYRCLEALRIMFIYSSSNYDIKNKIEKLQKLVETRVKYLDTKSWLSILRHNTNYGNSKNDILKSPLISMFL